MYILHGVKIQNVKVLNHNQWNTRLLLLDLKSTRQTYSDLQTFNRKKTSPRIAEKLLDSSSLLVETRETEPSNSEKKTGFQVLSKFFKGFQESVFVSDESFCCALVDPPLRRPVDPWEGAADRPLF